MIKNWDGTYVQQDGPGGINTLFTNPSELDEREAMRIFRRGEEEEVLKEVDELSETVRRAKMPETVEKMALKEIERLSKMGPSSAE